MATGARREAFLWKTDFATSMAVLSGERAKFLISTVPLWRRCSNLRSFGHKLFKLDAHVRGSSFSKYTRIDCGIPKEEMTRLSIDVFERNKHLLTG
jgi:hypothetical protein